MSPLRRERLFLALALVTYASLCVSGLLQSSETFDEGAHLAAGHTALTLHDQRLDLLHPPVAKLLAALALRGVHPRVDTQDPSWRTASLWAFSHRFLYTWNDARSLLLRGRLVTVLEGLLLAVAVFLFTRLHYGGEAACLSLFACVLSPDVIAQGQVVTTDLPAALFIFLAVWGFERLLAAPARLGFAATGLALGLALMTKQTGLLLLPILALLAIVSPPKGGRLKGLALLGGLGLVAWGVAWAVHGFRYAVSPDPAFEPLLRWPSGGGLPRLVAFARHHRLLPEGYLYGLLETVRKTQGRHAFLFGQYSDTGWWYYFPVAFLIKEPIPFLLGLGVAVWLGREHRAALRVEACLALPILGYSALALRSHLDIGLRHLLPVYPFLFVLLGRAAAVARGHLRGGTVLGLLALWQVAAVGFVHPHEIAYFNEFVGGPSRGYRYLVDSNIDWGQDLQNLARLVRTEALGPVKLSYFGTADPSYYGLEGPFLVGTSPRATRGPFTARVSPGDVLAVSVTNLQGVYLDPSGRRLMAEVRKCAPFARAGYSIYLFRATFRWLWDPEEARAWGHLAPVMPDYEAAAEQDPLWVEAREDLARARALLSGPKGEELLPEPPRR